MTDKTNTTGVDLDKLLNIGGQMANVMFNLAQRPGEALTGDVVATMDSLRKQWDAARHDLQAAPEAPAAWLATDLDGRGDVAFTKEEAKRRAGEGCTEFFPLYDLAPAAQQAGAAVCQPPSPTCQPTAAMCQPAATTASVQPKMLPLVYPYDKATTASATTPDRNLPLSEAEFLSKRLSRVARLAGVTMPSMSHEDIAAIAGTILGEIAFKLERAAHASNAGEDTERDAAETKLTMTQDNLTGTIRFKGQVVASDLERVWHDPFGRLLMRDLSKPGATSADMLLGLEFVFRAAIAASAEQEKKA
jgi:hypothetical protein